MVVSIPTATSEQFAAMLAGLRDAGCTVTTESREADYGYSTETVIVITDRGEVEQLGRLVEDLGAQLRISPVGFSPQIIEI